MKQLWPHQLAGIDGLTGGFSRGHRRGLLVMATGSGKTLTSAGMFRRMVAKGKRGLFVADRRVLVSQAARAFRAEGLPVGVVMRDAEWGFHDPHAPLQVCSKDTLVSWLERPDFELPPADLVATDEAHRGSGASWDVLRAKYPGVYEVGLTATPVFPNGKGMGSRYEFLVNPTTYAELQSLGVLVKPECYAPGAKITGKAGKRPSRATLVGDAVTWWRKHADGLKTFVFACDVAHSLALRNEYRLAGVAAEHIDGSTPDDERDDIFDRLATGDVLVVTNCNIARYGVDVKEAECCQILAPMGSFVEYRQSVGRVLRRADGKTRAVVLDHCLDDETEILTERGFVGRTGILDGDLVAAFDRNSGKASWQPILSRIDRKVIAGEQMVVASGVSVDLRVTGNHRMVCKKRLGNANHWSNEWCLREASDLAATANRYMIPVSGVQEAAGVPLTDHELRFIGWFITDGCVVRNRRVCIAQASHQPWVKDIKECLAGCGFDYTVQTIISPMSPNPQYLFNVPKGNCPARPRRGWQKLGPYLDKNLSPLLENLTEQQFDVLLHAIHLGDGAKDRKVGSYRITTGNRLFADRLQSLCVRRGYRCNTWVRHVTLKTICQPVAQTKPHYVLNIKKMASLSLHGGETSTRCAALKHAPATPGESVWCVENPLGTLFVRRGGKVAVVGNSGAVLFHGLPDADVDWTLDGDTDHGERHRQRMESGEVPQPKACRECGCLFSGRPDCPACGWKPARQPKPKGTTAGVLVRVEGNGPAAGRRPADLQKTWLNSLYRSMNRGMKVQQAAMIFRRETGLWPERAGVGPLPPDRASWSKPVRDVFPDGFN